MRQDIIQIKDWMVVNGQRVWVWSVIVSDNRVTKVKTKEGKLITVKS